MIGLKMFCALEAWVLLCSLSMMLVPEGDAGFLVPPLVVGFSIILIVGIRRMRSEVTA